MISRIGMAPLTGSYDTTLTRRIFESLATSAGICLHVRVIEGRNPRAGGIPSTKGVLS